MIKISSNLFWIIPELSSRSFILMSGIKFLLIWTTCLTFPWHKNCHKECLESGRTCQHFLRHLYVHILYGELESQTGGAPCRGIQGWEVRVEGSGGHRPAPVRAAPPVTIRLEVMRLGVIRLGVRLLDSGGGCIWVISASSLGSLDGNRTHFTILFVKGRFTSKQIRN